MSQAVQCKITGKHFTVSDKALTLLQTMGLPLPEVCFEESMRNLMAFRNERKLYHRKCDKTGVEILSAYRPDTFYTVYKSEVWWSDAWDVLEYGKDFDPLRPFFDQFRDLQLKVPREGTSVFNSENCAYNSHIRDSKNCFLNSLITKCENVYYCYWVVGDKDVSDSCMTNNSTLCYECIDCFQCYESVKLQNSLDCSNCYFSFELKSCKNCIGCSNLVNKTYYIFNKPATKEEFEKMKAELLNGNYTNYMKGVQYFNDLRKNAIHRASHITGSENATGDQVLNCKNCVESFNADNSEDIEESISISSSKNMYRDVSCGWPACEQVYSSAVIRGSSDIAFCYYIFTCHSLRYCDSCISCKDCFGCVGLRNKQYCILNKQYTKEEYEKLVPQIISSMKSQGEYGKFPAELFSTFAYNETASQDFYTLSKEEALQRGYQWFDEDTASQYQGVQYPFPENLSEVSPDITDAILQCETTGKPFKIIPQELLFYRTMNLPIPRICPEQRHKNRMSLRNPRNLWTRKCSKCETTIESSYSPERTEKVYCENCYLAEVY